MTRMTIDRPRAATRRGASARAAERVAGTFAVYGRTVSGTPRADPWLPAQAGLPIRRGPGPAVDVSQIVIATHDPDIDRSTGDADIRESILIDEAADASD